MGENRDIEKSRHCIFGFSKNSIFPFLVFCVQELRTRLCVLYSSTPYRHPRVLLSVRFFACPSVCPSVSSFVRISLFHVKRCHASSSRSKPGLRHDKEKEKKERIKHISLSLHERHLEQTKAENVRACQGEPFVHALYIHIDMQANVDEVISSLSFAFFHFHGLSHFCPPLSLFPFSFSRSYGFFTIISDLILLRTSSSSSTPATSRRRL